MLFDGLYGQNEIKKILTDLITGDRVGHAFVFCGPTGVGRKSFAKSFAKGIMCAHRHSGEEDACGACVGCTLMASETNPDFTVVMEDEGKNSIGVDTIRALQEDMAKAPEYGVRKVYVIGVAEKMTTEAQNALLKTLEEPAEYVVVILVCTNFALLLETIRSRVVRIDFSRNSDREVLLAMEGQGIDFEGQGISKSLVCAYADGIIGRALGIEDFEIFKQIPVEVLETLSLMPKGNVDFVLHFTRLFEQHEEHKDFVFFATDSVLRDVMVMARYGNQCALQNEQFKREIQRLTEELGYHRAVESIRILNEAWSLLRRNINYKLMVGSTAIKLREAMK